ncbi:ribonuclease VapC [Lysobacter helvus]|uniref:Ribonuclease VapC n=2 Tax=Lysobacteraceae TaxID=32033 RepID=A0ABM7Q952_9GAMM|nr:MULTISPECIES: type II toxin-antitoxin system VapC family toxin [Lysobacter]BCT93979.1 ribonuclease VapC [Lysobacter caseinilyticus]BCT97135.1 ribonuclease VapC [Lysobacter helvus]
MIVLDTNVVSELMRAKPEPRVLRWVDAQPAETVVVTAITVAEVLCGIARLPKGARRTGLEVAAAQTFDEDLMVLPFDDAAAVDYAAIAALQESRGRKLAIADAMIAATCLAAGATLATRNVRDFAGLGLEVVDPWR